MAFYLGIDAGGSKTECAIADERTTLGSFIAPTCKIQQVGREVAKKNLLAAVRGALLKAKVAGAEIRSSCVGISGISDPEVGEFVKKTLQAVVAGEVLAVGDHIIAHEAAFRGEAGVLVIAGTGSIAYGGNEKGETARAGGEGPEKSDEGSGLWIGREAIRRGVAVSEKFVPLREDSTLSLEKRQRQGWGSPLSEQGNPASPESFAELFPAVLAASKAGDALAGEILKRAGGELAKLAAKVIAQLWPNTEAPVRVAGAGGVLANSAEVRRALRESLSQMRSKAKFDEREVHPVEGALFLARKAANQKKTQDSSLRSE